MRDIKLTIEIGKDEFVKKLGIKDGETPTSTQLISLIKPLLVSPAKGDTGEKGAKGDTGEKGKDGSLDTPLQVKSKLLEAGIDYDEIGNTPDIPKLVRLYSDKSSKTYSLIELDDVLIENPTTGQILKYNATTRKWENEPDSSGSGIVVTVVAGTGISVDSTDPANPIVSGTITQYTDEMAQDAVGNAVGNGLDYNDTSGAISVDETELDHNSLGGKQGGILGQYNHITNAEAVVLANTSGVNTGNQTSIIGISGTKAEFNSALSDGDFLFVGDVAVPSFADNETPTGVIDTINTIFTLANTPSPTDSLILILNGQMLFQGIDYTLVGNTITYTSPPFTGLPHRAWYRY